MENLEKNFKIIKVLASCKKGIRNKILKKADDTLILTICECVLNTLNGNINLPTPLVTKLNKFKKTLRLLTNSNIKRNKKLLIQHGGFLNILLPTALTAISLLLEKFIK